MSVHMYVCTLIKVDHRIKPYQELIGRSISCYIFNYFYIENQVRQNILRGG